MDDKMTNKLISNFSYEIIERIVRFIVHLEEIETQFYSDKLKYKDKVGLIENYKITLYKILSLNLIGYKKNNNVDSQIPGDYFDLLVDLLSSINELHTTYLSILPRPSEPVELTRFERVIDKQIVQLTDKDNKREISISINEKIGEEISSDPLSDFKKYTINQLFSKYKIKERFGVEEFVNNNVDNLNNEKLHITIPRIDASNTFRWSSLIHEMAHSLFDKVYFKNENIENDFLKFVESDKTSILGGYFMPKVGDSAFPVNDTLRDWLKESWCDLFACILIGPSFYFSQYLTFFNEKPKQDKNDNLIHPPSMFRLDLIEAILSHRFPTELYEKLGAKYIGDCEDLIALMQDGNDISYKNTPELSEAFNLFNHYFISHFFSSTKEKGKGGNILLRNNEVLNEKLVVLVDKYVNIQSDIIDVLVSRLDLGLPIPSIKTENIDGKYEEFPTYIQEIFLASWITRCDTIKPKVLKLIDDFSESIVLNDIANVYRRIKEIILRHDQAVLKSIQVSEWFDFLIEEKRRPEIIRVFSNKKISNEFVSDLNGILVDSEIEELILHDELKIIPVMYMNQGLGNHIYNQIGTTSIDIRLGTSFQVFYPDQYGIIDFTEKVTHTKYNSSSKRINLDFIEGITITPGQFLLGHSMEYVKLPDYICGNLEGRSSFARLGIEIHMTAGFIDPGFEGVITFEIYNAGPTTVKLYPGMRIGQIRFEKNSIPKDAYSKKHTVKYKGLLEHDLSRQSKDVEVELIKQYNIKKKNKS